MDGFKLSLLVLRPPSSFSLPGFPPPPEKIVSSERRSGASSGGGVVSVALLMEMDVVSELSPEQPPQHQGESGGMHFSCASSLFADLL